MLHASKLSTQQTNPDVDGNCPALHRLASSSTPRTAKPAAEVSNPASATDRSPVLPTTCFPSSRQTDPFVGLSRRRGSRRSFAISSRDCHPTGRTHSGHRAQPLKRCCVRRRPSSDRTDRNLLRPLDSTTKRKEAEGSAKPAGHALRQCGSCVELSVVKITAVVAPSNVSKRRLCVVVRRNADRAATITSQYCCRSTDFHNSPFRLSAFGHSYQ